MPLGSIISGIIGAGGAAQSGAAAGEAGQTAWNNAQHEIGIDRSTINSLASLASFGMGGGFGGGGGGTANVLSTGAPISLSGY